MYATASFHGTLYTNNLRSGFCLFYSSVGIYLDTVNIFIRIAMILAGGGGKRK